MDINQYFPTDSIFNDDSDLSDSPDDRDSLSVSSTEEKDVYIPRLKFQNLQNFQAPIYSKQKKDDPNCNIKTVFITEAEVHQMPAIKTENSKNDFVDNYLSDTSSPPLQNKKRRTLDVSGDSGGMRRQTESGLYKSRRESCTGFTWMWQKDSIEHEKYENLLANEGLEYSEYKVKSRRISSKNIVFYNRIYPFAKDSKIQLPVCSQDKRSGDGNLLELESTFCVPAACSNVSSIIPYGSGQCWVATDVSKNILLYDRNGDLMDFVNVGCPVDSLATDKDGNVFISCPDLKQVRVVDRHRHMRTFLDMTQYPRGIAYMRLEDSILVCRNDNKIANDLTVKACNPLRKYPIRGPKSSKPRDTDVAENMFGYPFRVCVNVNDDCIVSDFAHRSITVLDSAGRIRFTFNSSKDFPIRNCDSVCCDQKGNIYILLKGNPNVCVLGPGGNIKTIFSCCDFIYESVFTTVFDSNDYLWVACMDGFIKIFRKI
ncbi:uncharacterized protein LOC134235645 [Saccostrea cucullata]|uniref:uncharacterized protein LOC134235645 n=1 Tax=Saccostrea cuccullata TaxID=36930 RepID=UPI002ED339E9